MYTLNQIVKKIKTIGEAHVQIRTVHYGSLQSLLAKQDIVYPAMCFLVRTSTIASKRETFPIEFWFIDRLNIDDPEHETEVHSDTLSMSTDIVAKMMDQQSYEWLLGDGANRNFFADDVSTPDASAGLMMELTINQPLRTDRCLLPTSFNQRVFADEFSQEFE